MKNEVGLINNPLKISWLEGQPRSGPSTVLSDSARQPRTSQVQRRRLLRSKPVSIATWISECALPYGKTRWFLAELSRSC